MRCFADGDDAGAQVLPDQGSSGGCVGRPCSRYLKRSAIDSNSDNSRNPKLLREYH